MHRPPVLIMGLVRLPVQRGSFAQSADHSDRGGVWLGLTATLFHRFSNRKVSRFIALQAGSSAGFCL